MLPYCPSPLAVLLERFQGDASTNYLYRGIKNFTNKLQVQSGSHLPKHRAGGQMINAFMTLETVYSIS